MIRLGTLPRPRIVLALLAAVTMFGAGACTSDEPAAAPNGPPDFGIPAELANTVPGSAPEPAQRCRQGSDPPAIKMVITTADNVHLAGVRFGSGPRGVVLLPQAGADLCRWWYYAYELVRAGFHVLAIDLRGTGYSESGDKLDYSADAIAAVSALKKAGAQKVVLVGASLGAATALVAAARAPDEISGVVAISYPDDNLDVTGGGSSPRTPAEAAPLIRAPVMLCFTADDPQVSKAKPIELAEKMPALDKQLVGRPGVSHGWDMLKAGVDDVRPDILGFLSAYA